jgi:hypothetical protein
MKNRFGLNRDIPLEIKREIRQRSKNGCVVCRCGVYQYEHIEPEYKDAVTHDPAVICCLCARCHDKVTRGLLSKQSVFQSYQRVQTVDEIDNPREFFDFHTGEAKLLFGNLICEPVPESVFRCYGTNVFSVEAGNSSEPGKINSIFCDDDGQLTFQIIGNEWIGPTSSYDLEIVGQRFTVRLPNGRISLKLRHTPPGIVTIERLDMRYKDIHLLASEFDLALGRYTGHNNNLIWLHVKARIDQIFSQPIAIEVNPTEALTTQYQCGLSAKNPGIIFNQNGKSEYALVTDQELAHRYNLTECGIHWPALGFQIAKGCEFALCAVATGVCSIEHARNKFFSKNRMNVPGLYLPARINATKLRKEYSKAGFGKKSDAGKYLSEPFLVLEDKRAIKEWNTRQTDKNDSKNFVATPFLDDKPGCYFATGVIKLVDSYNGPAIRVGKTLEP